MTVVIGPMKSCLLGANFKQNAGKYDGLPRLVDPNVTVTVIGTASSSRARELSAPKAAFYAWLARILLLDGLTIFAFISYVILRFKP